MDALTPNHEDDLSEFERLLAGWQPSSDGLNADAMLFAAGQAAARRGRSQRIWPILCHSWPRKSWAWACGAYQARRTPSPGQPSSQTRRRRAPPRRLSSLFESLRTSRRPVTT